MPAPAPGSAGGESRPTGGKPPGELVESLPEQALAELVELAARISDASLALLALTHEDRVWFKSSAEDIAPEALRDLPFHAAALAQHDLLLVSDAAQDERFAHHPLVAGEPGIRFYAGVPLCAAGMRSGSAGASARSTVSTTVGSATLQPAIGAGYFAIMKVPSGITTLRARNEPSFTGSSGVVIAL